MRPRNFTGILLAREGDAIQRAHLLECKALEFVGAAKGNLHWEHYSYSSPTPLRNEVQAELNQKYCYTLLVRRSGQKVLLMGESLYIIKTLASRELQSVFRPTLLPCPIDINALVRNLVLGKHDYVPCFVHVRTPGSPGQVLRAMTLYGSDLSKAEQLSRNIELIESVTCGLTRRDDGREIIRMRNDGVVYFAGLNRLGAVEDALRFVSSSGLIADYGSKTARSSVSMSHGAHPIADNAVDGIGPDFMEAT